MYMYIYFCRDLLPDKLQWGFFQNVIRMQWDCGKTPILISVYLTEISSHSPIALTLFKKCGGNETVHRSGPPPRTRNFLKENLVHEYLSKTCTRCSVRKCRILGGGPAL